MKDFKNCKGLNGMILLAYMKPDERLDSILSLKHSASYRLIMCFSLLDRVKRFS